MPADKQLIKNPAAGKKKDYKKIECHFLPPNVKPVPRTLSNK
jgi:hypothetical protein